MKNRPVYFGTSALVPLYGSRVALVLAAKKELFHVHAKRYYGRVAGVEISQACSMFGGGRFSVCFVRGKIAVDDLAHEVFHLTTRILQWHGVEFDANNHEAHAYLNGWLTGWVYKQLRKQGERVAYHWTEVAAIKQPPVKPQKRR